MLKRLGLAGLLFATLAVAPFTVAARDRNDSRDQNNFGRTSYASSTYTQSRYTRDNSGWNRGVRERDRRASDRHRFIDRDDDSYRGRTEGRSYDYR